MASSHHWRRRQRATGPRYLAIMDHDNRRYTIEGPVNSGDAWIIEVFRACRAGRRLEFYWLENENLEGLASDPNDVSSYERWPSKSIVQP